MPFIQPNRRNEGAGRIGIEQDDSIYRPCISLDDFLGQEISVPTLIKMDIEGAELLAVRGGRHALASRKALVSLLIETHPEEIVELGGSLEKLEYELSELGFKVQGISANGLTSLSASNWSRFWWAEG